MKLCSVEGCGRESRSLSFCQLHYLRFKRGSDLTRPVPIAGDKAGTLNPKWRGGCPKMPDGRVLIYAPNHPRPGVAGIYVLRYRLVAEKMLGRYLADNEVVHHINGDCSDDRPENLQVMTQGEHAAIHSSIAGWARKHTHCRNCGTTDRRHHGNGLCQKCASEARGLLRYTKRRMRA